jgi:hypothetical protein
MERAAADSEFFRRRSYVAIGRCKGLGNQFFPPRADRAGLLFRRTPGELKLLSLSGLLRGDPDSITMTAW